MARVRDHELAEAKATGKVDQLGAFFGVPVSIKDQFGEAGENATAGSQWMAAHYKAPCDSAIVAMLKKEGAVPMVRGNVP